MNKTNIRNEVKILLFEKCQGKKVRLVPESKKTKSCTLKSELSHFDIEYRSDDEWVLMKANTRATSDEFQSSQHLWIIPKAENKHETVLIEYELHNDPATYRQEFHLYQFELDLKLDKKCFESPHPKDHSIGKYHWVWGKTNGEDNAEDEASHSNKQWGGIILADVDEDTDDFDFSKNPKGGVSELMKLSVKNPFRNLPKSVEFQLYLETTFSDVHHFGLYTKKAGKYTLVLGSERKRNSVELSNNPQEDDYKLVSKVCFAGEHFYLRANYLPNSFFDGIITVKLKLKNEQAGSPDFGKTLAEDHVIVRVAPWMMMPNTQEVKAVHVMRINSGSLSEQAKSEQFINTLKTILKDKLVVADTSNFEGDRWLRDEFVVGYCQGVNQLMPVVCGGPRDRGLNKYPDVKLLKEDFGHVVIAGNKRSTLDSFGNLEVSPPVAGYPFGRIIIGASPKQGFKNSPRQIAHQIKGFLHAQKVQSPIEIFSDWLAVGHVDEMINFVPTNHGKKFKMLMASSKKAIDILSYIYFSDTHQAFYLPLEHKEQKSRDVLKKWLHSHWEINHRVQLYLDWNRSLLKKELKLEESDIIDVPVIFKERKSDGRALPLLPNMVNQLVITEKNKDGEFSSFSIAPKSYGPVKTSASGLTPELDSSNSQYLFEDQLKSELEAIGHKIHFVDDVDLYFKRGGDIHCATNVERKFFENRKWWKYKPDHAHDI